MANVSGYLPELYMGLSSLLVHKLRSLLTMLGMIFGVGAVVAMLSITAGAQKEMINFIDQLGVNNVIIEAREAGDMNELQAMRAISPGLTFRDYRAIAENVQGIEEITPRKRFKLQRVVPKTTQEVPQLIGVLPNYQEINSIKLVSGRFFTQEENMRSEAVCVLGETAKVNLLGYDDAVGKYIKANDVWYQVIGVMSPQAMADSDSDAAQSFSRNNLIIAPLNTVMRRMDDNMGFLKDEIDGIYRFARANVWIKRRLSACSIPPCTSRAATMSSRRRSPNSWRACRRGTRPCWFRSSGMPSRPCS